MHPLFLDTETTDVNSHARLVQLAYKNGQTGEEVNEFFKPPTPISFGAMSIHHITNEMVEDKPAFDESGHKERIQSLLADFILVAHNAPFDIAILVTEGVNVDDQKYIDTLRVARHLIESPQHKLQYLRYSLKLPITGPNNAHDALSDIYVLEALYHQLTDTVKTKFSLSDTNEVMKKMIELTHLPVLLTDFKFGKYKGKTFKEVSATDPGYIQWLYTSETTKPEHEQNEDLVYTLKNYA